MKPERGSLLSADNGLLVNKWANGQMDKWTNGHVDLRTIHVMSHPHVPLIRTPTCFLAQG